MASESSDNASAQKWGKKKVIIVGAGFGGLNAAKSLAGKSEVDVTVIDQKNHHLFQPLLYQVATAGLSSADIAVPIRAQFSGVENIEVHLDRIDSVDLEKKLVKTRDNSLELPFDYLILACGARHSYFDHPEWEKFAPGLKTLEQATEIRRRILSAFEQAENELDPNAQEALLNFVVVGGGPTGVELAGAIADVARTVLVNDFKRISPSQAKVYLVEAGPKILASFSESLSSYTREALESLGVEVRLSSRVENITENGIQVGGQFLSAKTVFWAAGVRANQISMPQNIVKDKAGRIKVQSDLTVPGFRDVFVIGDMALAETSSGRPVPGLAPAAIQEGKYVAQMILKSIRDMSRTDFHYADKGQMATIGKNKAVMQFGKLHLTGHLAWMSWLFVHLFFLVGFKSRVFVLIEWIWNYVFSKRGARLITDRDWKLSDSV